VEHGADIHQENENGETPLFKACSNGHEAVVKIFSGTGSRYPYEK